MGWQYIEGSWDNPQVTDREIFKQVLISDRAKAALSCSAKHWHEGEKSLFDGIAIACTRF